MRICVVTLRGHLKCAVTRHIWGGGVAVVCTFRTVGLCLPFHFPIATLTQVGIVALNLIGDPLAPQPAGPPGGGAAYLEVGQQPAGEMGYYNRWGGSNHGMH